MLQIKQTTVLVPLYGSNFHLVFRDSQKLVREYYQTKQEIQIINQTHCKSDS